MVKFLSFQDLRVMRQVKQGWRCIKCGLGESYKDSAFLSSLPRRNAGSLRLRGERKIWINAKFQWMNRLRRRGAETQRFAERIIWVWSHLASAPSSSHNPMNLIETGKEWLWTFRTVIPFDRRTPGDWNWMRAKENWKHQDLECDQIKWADNV